jgi:hypothetical protein
LHSSSLKFLRSDHRHEEVDEEEQSDDRNNDGFHGVFLKPVAKAHVKRAQNEEHDDHANEEKVSHNSLKLTGGLAGPLIKRRAPGIKKSLNPSGRSSQERACPCLHSPWRFTTTRDG